MLDTNTTQQAPQPQAEHLRVNGADTVAQEPAPAAPPPERPSGPVIIDLHKPVRAHDDPKKMKLTLREPTVHDMQQVGVPWNLEFTSGRPQPVMADPIRVTAMLARLANVAPTTIEEMDTRDWNTAAWAIAHFFLPDMRVL
jgi:hypothetical protein